MKKVLLLTGVFLFVFGIACFTKEVTGLLIPIVGYYYFRGIPAEPDRMPDKFFGVYSHVPYVLIGAGLLFMIISLLLPKNGDETPIKWNFKLPKFKTWKKRRTVFQLVVLGLIAVHIILFTLGITSIKAICPAGLAIGAIKGTFGIAAVFWSFILIGTIFGGRFLCGWLCVFAPVQENADNILTATGNRSKAKKHLHPAFIYTAAFIFWGSVIFNIIMNINNLTFDIYSGTSNPIGNIWMFIAGLLTVIPLVMFFIFLWGSRFFCRNVCPIGGLLRIYSRFSFLKIKIDHDKCTDCSACSRNCQMNVNIDGYIKSGSASIKDGDCIVCGDCIDNCPKKALSFGIA
ncbi:MAG: 4Fe-4S binding protein [Spirochaetes bacterium]|jgi:polyferredoxin|nr:4Fe-4S binding protein [Spirochaetota bacterium]